MQTKPPAPVLAAQQERVWALMQDGNWRTLRAIADACRCSETSASARLRDFRKQAFNDWAAWKHKRPVLIYVDRIKLGPHAPGLYRYRVRVEDSGQREIF